ncbi:hypothetical protein EU811_20935 [Arthrobacter sp. TS-15]|uniref:hypothetical protein n=1 Tax=Arthrobacter sp. TS-15 TaxID=2510797 RepID=UPI00115DAB49|nr:hypothetical protein [Arthrobacter sp. TS-15]TQS88611.1 hypothetical protein EU811_20935 [Arthrobacter sp. TS-15]
MDISTLLIPVVAAFLALLGNSLLLRLQTRVKTKEELRAFVRELHSGTVDLVVDLDLLVRELRSSFLYGSPWSEEEQARVSELAKTAWEGDLLRRTRKISYGHPDPDVRDASHKLDTSVSDLITVVRTTDTQRKELGWRLLDHTDYQKLFIPVERSMKELRAAVYQAPRRDVPSRTYDGSTRSSTHHQRLEATLGAGDVEKKRAPMRVKGRDT